MLKCTDVVWKSGDLRPGVTALHTLNIRGRKHWWHKRKKIWSKHNSLNAHNHIVNEIYLISRKAVWIKYFCLCVFFVSSVCVSVYLSVCTYVYICVYVWVCLCVPCEDQHVEVRGKLLELALALLLVPTGSPPLLLCCEFRVGTPWSSPETLPSLPPTLPSECKVLLL